MTYLICWSFILSISYFHFPIEFHGAKYLLNNFADYLSQENNPFAELHWGSRNNLSTLQDVKNLLLTIIYNIKNKFL